MYAHKTMNQLMNSGGNTHQSAKVSRFPSEITLEITELAKVSRFPSEITELILCLLPVKSLKRFCCVSTSWRSLISDNFFTRKHLITASARRDEIFQKILNSGTNPMDLEGLPLSSLETINIYNQFDDFCFTEITVEFIAACDGLICVSISPMAMLYICNPGMKIKRRVRSSTAAADPNSNHYSFGYDSTSNDYKLLKLSRKYCGNYATEIYSLKTDSWTKVVDFPHDFNPSNYCEFLNGAIHWLSRNRKDRSYFVCSFNLSENKYTKLPLPQDDQVTMADSGPQIISLEYGIVRLHAVGGMLCTLNSCGTKGFVLWGNKDHKDKTTSWSKILTVPFERIPDRYYNHIALKPLYVYESGEVLIGIVLGDDFEDMETQLMVFKDDRVLFQQITSHPLSVISEGFVHVESLISPFHNN